jgi:hypothetical protein
MAAFFMCSFLTSAPLRARYDIVHAPCPGNARDDAWTMPELSSFQTIHGIDRAAFQRILGAAARRSRSLIAAPSPCWGIGATAIRFAPAASNVRK